MLEQKSKRLRKKNHQNKHSIRVQTIVSTRIKIRRVKWAKEKGQGRQKHHEANPFTQINYCSKPGPQKEADWEGRKAIQTSR